MRRRLQVVQQCRPDDIERVRKQYADLGIPAELMTYIEDMGAKLAEPYVVVLLTDIDPQMRLNAFHTLQALGVDPRPGLKKALSHPELKTRITTASLMTQLNLELELAAPILVEGLKADDEGLKMQAAHALSLRGLREVSLRQRQPFSARRFLTKKTS